MVQAARHLRATFLAFGILCLALAGLTACDPALRLVVQNHTAQPALMTSILPNAARPDTALRRSLPPGRTYLSYGIGVWNEPTMRRIARQFHRLEIATATDTLRLTDSLQVYNFFRSCPRKGAYQSELLIELK